MIRGIDITTIIDIPVTLRYTSGTGESFILEAPNAGKLFSYEISLNGNSLYNDGSNRLRKGSRLYRVNLLFEYSSHRMNLAKLFACKSIEFDPTIFHNRLEVIFGNTLFKMDESSITKNWMNGLPITQKGETIENANPIPSGALTLKMQSVKPFYFA